VPQHLSCAVAADWLQTWLRNCDDAHADCRLASSPVPHRVLDLSSDTARLVEFPQDQQPPHGKYATLSHCWANPSDSKPPMTTKNNFTWMQRGILTTDMSPLFRDAIQLCRSIGCNYIWIDSLCIIQDDDDDWSAQSQSMSEIYSNAYFNIAAVASPNSTQGLFQERWNYKGRYEYKDFYPIRTYDLKTRLMPEGIACVRDSHYRDHHYVEGQVYQARGKQAPLFTRAWVLQELLLARRTLYVCASELIWECKTLSDCECGTIEATKLDDRSLGGPSIASPPSIDRFIKKRFFSEVLANRHSSQAIFDNWLRLCSQYSILQISKHTDRPVALAGLVKAIQHVLGGRMAAGMWEEDLPRALLWKPPPPLLDEVTRSAGLPTWSWMSRVESSNTCEVSYVDILRNGFCQNPKMSICVRGGDLTFEGLSLPAIIRTQFLYPPPGQPRTWHYVLFGPDAAGLPCTAQTTFNADCPTSPRDNLKEGDSVECLLFGTLYSDEHCHYALVVRKHVEASGVYYTRVGRAILRPLKQLSGIALDCREIANVKKITIR
jgi:hypothetical protein